LGRDVKLSGDWLDQTAPIGGDEGVAVAIGRLTALAIWNFEVLLGATGTEVFNMPAGFPELMKVDYGFDDKFFSSG